MTATSDSIIDALGGTGAVSSALSLADSTVSTWRERGIPPARWAELVGLAGKLGVHWITFELLAALPRPAERAEACG